VHYDIELNSAAHLSGSRHRRPVAFHRTGRFGAFWKGESNSTDPLVLLSAIAARTSKLKLGTAIYHIYGRSAVTLGIQSATIQDLSGGRLLLGLGVANKTSPLGTMASSTAPCGAPANISTSSKKTAAGERVEYEGDLTTQQALPLSWQPDHPSFPIYLAGLGPQMTKLVGKISDGVFINMGTPATIREIASRVREGRWKRAAIRTPIEIIAKVRVSLNPDRAMARSKLRQVLTFYNIAVIIRTCDCIGLRAEVMRIQDAFKAGGFSGGSAHDDDYMDKLPVIPGTSIKEIKERLEPSAKQA